MSKNMRKVPSSVEAKIEAFGDKPFVVGCAKHYRQAEIVAGKLQQFGIVINEKGVACGSGEVLPPKTAGRYSRRNICGCSITRRDMPKVMHEIPYSVTDWHGEHHSGTYPRLCYQRENIEPAKIKIEAKVIVASADGANVAFRLKETFTKKTDNLNRRLLSGLNIMRENVGTCDVEPESVPMDSYEVMEQVSWKIFPDGMGIAGIVKAVVRARTPEEAEKKRKIAAEHLTFLRQLGAAHFVRGTDAFDGYVGAIFDDGVCVFDNVHYGNAAYVLKGAWKDLTKLSRTELRRRSRQVATPVSHRKDWKAVVCRAIKQLRQVK